ncbi:phage tail assembly protein [Methylophaga thiooxydans]|nr:phage tail assembly protein [Methylophaga thiooxydans]
MATITISLEHGVKMGDKTHTTVLLRELTPGDIIDAGLASERVTASDDGYVFAVSPTLMGLHTLAKQIESIGDYDGIVDIDDLRKFHREDFELLQFHAERLDQAVLESVMQRGKHDASGGEPELADD